MSDIGRLHKASLLTSTGSNNKELMAGADGQVLTLDSTQPVGMKWGTGGNGLHTARYIVSAGGLNDGANYTTIASAITAAVAATGNQTIFIQPGTYTENITLPPGINLSAYDCDALTPNVTILGKMTFNGGGKSCCSGINFQTNGDYAIYVTTSSTGTLYFTSCSVSSFSFTGMLLENQNVDCFFINCTTSTSSGYVLFLITTTNGCEFYNCRLGQSSSSQNTISGGQVSFYNSTVGIVLLTASGGYAFYRNCVVQPALNITALETSGSGYATITNCNFTTGSATAIIIDSGTYVIMTCSSVDSTAASAISGAGILKYGGVSFVNTTNITVSTQNPIAFSIAEGGTNTTSFSNNYGTTYFDGTKLNNVASGTSGQVLTSNGAAAPSFQTVSGGGTVTSVSGTTNRITSTGGTTPVIDISASYVGQSSLTTVGTLSSGIVPTTLVKGAITGTAPAAGYIGEQIKGYNGTGTSLTTSTYSSITNIVLTPGIWNISCIGQFNFTGVTQQSQAGISTSATSLTLSIVDASITIQNTQTAGTTNIIIPSYGVNISSTTTYYFIANCVFSSGTAIGFGRISATRVA